MLTVEYDNHLVKCVNCLKESFICRMRSLKILYLSFKWLHTIFITVSDLLIEINFDVIETLLQMSFDLDIHLEYFEYELKYVKKDLDIYFNCFLKSLSDKNEHVMKTHIFSSWTELCSSIRNISSLSKNVKDIMKV